MKYKYDVIIIGAGMIGSAIAYFLSKEKYKVAVIEKGNIGEGTSSACDGIVFLQSKKPGISMDLALESIHILKELVNRFDRDIEYKQKGGLIVFQSESERNALKKQVNDLQRIGINIQLLSRNETLEIEPFLSEQVIGSSFCSIDGSINPIATTLAFAETAIKNGIDFYQRTIAEKMMIENDHVVGVKCSNSDKFYSNYIVLSTGIFTNSLLKDISIQLPIKPRRGQVIITEPIAPLIHHPMLSGRYIAAKLIPEMVSDLEDPLNRIGIGLVLEQANSGNLLIGSTREFVGENTDTSYEGIEYILKHATSIVPSLKDINIIRSFSGLRPYTDDGLPFISRMEPYDNLIVAAGHEGDGITLSAITGKLVKQMILDEKMDYDINKLSYNRIAKK